MNSTLFDACWIFGRFCTRRIFLYKPGPLTCLFFSPLFHIFSCFVYVHFFKKEFSRTKKSFKCEKGFAIQGKTALKKALNSSSTEFPCHQVVKKRLKIDQMLKRSPKPFEEKSWDAILAAAIQTSSDADVPVARVEPSPMIIFYLRRCRGHHTVYLFKI